MFLLIAFVEGIILRFLNWGDMWQSLFDSLMINFFTTIVGLIMAITFFDIFPTLYGLPSNLGEILPEMILLWAVTVLIEGLLLGITRRKSIKETWGATFVINTCSYAILVAVIPLSRFGGYL
jgi:hypothetical protein